MAVVKMISAYGSNCTGDVCGFPDATAAKLVKKGVAVYVTAAPVGAVTKAASAPPPAQSESRLEASLSVAPMAEAPTPEPAAVEEEKVGGLFRRGKKKG